MSIQFDNVSVIKKANIFFDGKCISHAVIFPDGTKKTIGVILPSTLVFNTDAAEIMEIVAGKCRIQLANESSWQTIEEGQSFNVPGTSHFTIEVLEPLHYVCHFITA